MSSTEHRVADVKICKDCRLHRPEAQMYTQLCEILDVDDCYIGAEAGVEGAILNDPDRRAGAFKNAKMIKDLKRPDVFAVVGHYDCAGHNVSDTQHDIDIIAAAEQFSEALFGTTGHVVALIAYPNHSPENGPTWLLKRVDVPQPAVATVSN